MFRLFYQLTTIQLHVTSAIKWCICLQIIESCELMKLSPKNIGIKMEISYRERAKIWLAIENNRTSSINNMLHPMLML